MTVMRLSSQSCEPIQSASGVSGTCCSHTRYSRQRHSSEIDRLGFCRNCSRQTVRYSCWRTNVLLPPQRDVQQCPSPFLQERLDPLELEKVGVFAKVLHLFDKIFPEFGVIPFVHRYAEALLFPVDKLVRYHSPDCFLQNIFEYPISGFYRLRNAHCQLYELMVEKRDARFQTHPHPHLVDAHEQQFRQSQIHIEIRHPIERRGLPGFFLEALSNRPKSIPRTQLSEF